MSATPAAASRSLPLNMLEQLQLECEGYRALEKLLAEEEQALLAMASERVADLAGEKERLTRDLEELAANRATLLARLGVNGTPAGMREWLERHPEQRETAGNAWKQLQLASGRSHRRNESNGRLIGTLLAHVQARLNIISSAGGSNPIYGSNGMAQVLRPPKALGRA